MQIHTTTYKYLHGKLVRPVPIKNRVRVSVDQSGYHATARGIHLLLKLPMRVLNVDIAVCSESGEERCLSLPLMYKTTTRFNTEMSRNASHLVTSAKLFPAGGKSPSFGLLPAPLTQLLLCCLDRPRQRLVPIALPLWELPRHLEPRPWAPSRHSYTPGPAGVPLGCARVQPWLEDKSGWGLQLFARGCSVVLTTRARTNC